jgi:hypothetical protein
MGSIVKNQSLSFKIPSEMAVTAMYGSNTPKGAPIDDNSHVNSEISSQFQVDTGDEYRDGYLNDLQSTHKEWGLVNGVPSGNKIGSKNSSVNSKITKNDGNLKILGQSAPWMALSLKEQKVDTVNEESVELPDTKEGNAKKGYSYKNAEWHYSETKNKIIDLRLYNVSLSGPTPDATSTIGAGPALPKKVDGNFLRGKGKATTDTGYYAYDKESRSFVLIPDIVPMVKKIINGTLDTEGIKTAYHQDFIVPAELGLEIDGTEGLIPGDLIQVDYIPAKYKKEVIIDTVPYGPFTYFQIFKLSHKISSAGWTTDIGTKMRVNSEILNQIAGGEDILNQLRSGELIKKFESGQSNTTFNTAQDIDGATTVADNEFIGPPEFKKEAFVYPDDYTDPELIEYSIVTDPDAIGFGTVLADEESIIGAEPGMSAVELGMSTTPPPLTGLNQNGAKVASMDKGPNGEEIKTNSKGKFFYHPNGDTSKAVIVQPKVNPRNETEFIEIDSKPDEGLVLISDLFSYNLAGDFMTNVSEEPVINESSEVEEQRADRTNIETALTNPIEVIY